MTQDILIIGVLFPAIPLMMINFGNRYASLSALIRKLHDRMMYEGVNSDDEERILRQLKTLRMRLQLVRIIQTCAGVAFILALLAMIAFYFRGTDTASFLFISSIVLMGIAMLMFIFEILVANHALDVHLSDMEEFRGDKKRRAKKK